MLITSQSDFYASAETIYLLNRDYTSQPTLYINENQPTNEYIITNCTFTNSRNQLGNGGALNIQLTNGGSASAKNVTISDCQAINGGAIYAEIRSLGKLIIEGSYLISNCTSQQNGGGINCIILDIGSTVDIIGSVTIYNCSSSGNAGGLYVSMNSGLFQCNNMYVQECKSLNNGGGIYIDIINGGELILDNGCQLIQCISEQGNGGAIYIDIDFEQQSQFKIKDALIQSCEAKYNSQSNSPTGYGGGIFLVGSVNFDVSQRLLDFHGLKTNGNLASYNGQSLYVVMAKIDSWCKQGNYGEYVKGNYSNSKSSLGELQGIATSFGTFSKMTIQQISALTQHLQLLWSQSAVVTKVSAIINQNNIDAPLLFIIEGHGMISGQFYVKLFEIRDKTEEEIEQDMNDNKQSLYNNNQNNSIKSSIKTNSQLKNDKNSYHCNEFELIWPDNDGTGSQIAIDGSPQGQQTASFGMKDAKWYNYQKKLYGILGSNDGVTFTGVKGKINKTVLLQTQIEKETHLDQIVDEQPIKPKGTGIPTWVIILIILIILLLVCVIITNGLYYFFRWWNSNEQRIKRIKSDFAEFKNQHENNKQQLLQYPDTNKEQFSGKLLKGSSFLFKAKSQKQSLQHQSEIDQLQKKEPYQKFPPSPIPNQIPESAIQTPPRIQQKQNPPLHFSSPIHNISSSSNMHPLISPNKDTNTNANSSQRLTQNKSQSKIQSLHGAQSLYMNRRNGLGNSQSKYIQKQQQQNNYIQTNSKSPNISQSTSNIIPSNNLNQNQNSFKSIQSIQIQSPPLIIKDSMKKPTLLINNIEKQPSISTTPSNNKQLDQQQQQSSLPINQSNSSKHLDLSTSSGHSNTLSNSRPNTPNELHSYTSQQSSSQSQLAIPAQIKATPLIIKDSMNKTTTIIPSVQSQLTKQTSNPYSIQSSSNITLPSKPAQIKSPPITIKDNLQKPPQIASSQSHTFLPTSISSMNSSNQLHSSSTTYNIHPISSSHSASHLALLKKLNSKPTTIQNNIQNPIPQSKTNTNPQTNLAQNKPHIAQPIQLAAPPLIIKDTFKRTDGN